MGTSRSGVAQLLDGACASRSAAPVHHGRHGNSALRWAQRKHPTSNRRRAAQDEHTVACTSRR